MRTMQLFFSAAIQEALRAGAFTGAVPAVPPTSNNSKATPITTLDNHALSPSNNGVSTITAPLTNAKRASVQMVSW